MRLAFVLVGMLSILSSIVARLAAEEPPHQAVSDDMRARSEAATRLEEAFRQNDAATQSAVFFDVLDRFCTQINVACEHDKYTPDSLNANATALRRILSGSSAQTPPAPSPGISAVTEADAPGSPTSVGLLVVNRSSTPVNGVTLQTFDKKWTTTSPPPPNRLAGPIPSGSSFTIADIAPSDHVCLRITKANNKTDTWCMGLRVGTSYTYTIRDGESEYAALTIVNDSAFPVTTVNILPDIETNLLSSPIQAGGQVAITRNRPGALGWLPIVRIGRVEQRGKSGEIIILYWKKLSLGEAFTYSVRKSISDNPFSTCKPNHGYPDGETCQLRPR